MIKGELIIFPMNTLPLNKLIRPLALFVCCGFAFIAASAQATVITWNLNPTGVNADVGSSSADFTVSGYTISAYGFDNNNGIGSPHQLHYKNEGGDEVGLGVTGTSDFELEQSNGTPLEFIQLSLTSILQKGFTNGKIEIGSAQSGESFNLYGSNALGTLGTLLNSTPFGSSSDDKFVAVPNFGSYDYISVVSVTGDVLPVAFQASVTPVPEAASLIPALCLVAAVTAFEARRRRRTA